MWGVGKCVDRSEGNDVNPSFPQNCAVSERSSGVFIHEETRIFLTTYGQFALIHTPTTTTSIYINSNRNIRDSEKEDSSYETRN